MAKYQTLFPGDQVKHSKYGEGTVLRTDPDGVVVRFADDQAGGETGLEMVIKDGSLDKVEPKFDSILLEAVVGAGEELFGEDMGDESGSEEEPEEQDQPEEDDIFLTSSGQLGAMTSVSAGGEFLGEFSEMEDAEAAIKAWMEKNQFFPNIWQVSDHGNIERYTLEAKVEAASPNDGGDEHDPQELYDQLAVQPMAQKMALNPPKPIREVELEDEQGDPTGEVIKIVQETHPSHENMIGIHLQDPEERDIENAIDTAIKDGYEYIWVKHSPKVNNAAEEADECLATAPQDFKVGDDVERGGNKGKVSYVSKDQISVEWDGDLRGAEPIPANKLKGIKKVQSSLVQVVAKQWSGDIKTKWHPKEGFFEQSAEKIAHGLKSESKDLKQAMARLNFYMNRAGENLSAEQKDKLENAKKKLHDLYGKKSEGATEEGATQTEAAPEINRDAIPQITAGADKVELIADYLSNSLEHDSDEDAVKHMEKEFGVSASVAQELLTVGKSVTPAMPEAELHGKIQKAVSVAAPAEAAAKPKWHIVDWMGNVKFHGQTFDSFEDGEEFLSEHLGDAYETDRQEFDVTPVKETREARYMDPKDPRNGTRKIKSSEEGQYRLDTTYAVVTPESAKVGDFADHGYHEQERMFDSLEEMAQFIAQQGPVENSGSWFSGIDPERDLHDGSETTYDFHPKKADGSELSKDEYEQLWQLMKGVKGGATVGAAGDKPYDRIYITDEDSEKIGKPWEVKIDSAGNPEEMAEHFADKFFGAGQWQWDEQHQAIEAEEGKIELGSGGAKTPVAAALDEETRKSLIERLAALEHDQWWEWAESVKSEVSEERAARWETYFVPYEQLDKAAQQLDIEWAEEVMDIVEPVINAIEAPKQAGTKELVTRVEIDSAAYPNLALIGASLEIVTAKKKAKKVKSKKSRKARASKGEKKKKRPTLHGLKVKAAPDNHMPYEMLKKVDYLHAGVEDFPIISELILGSNDPLVQQYLASALWSSTDDDGTSFDDKYDISDIDPASLANAERDVSLFIEMAGPLLDGEDMEAAMHDFWLTRNGHGSGFWDGDYEDEKGEKLTELSKQFGEQYIYVGDDGKLHIEGGKVPQSGEPEAPTPADEAPQG